MLNVYKVEPDAKIPNYETRKSACFDLSAYISSNEDIKVFAGKTESMYKPEFDSKIEKNFMGQLTTTTGLHLTQNKTSNSFWYADYALFKFIFRDDILIYSYLRSHSYIKYNIFNN